MKRFTVIPQDTFDGLQIEAGVLLTNFDPSNPVAPADEDILCATTGGITASCVPTFSDYGDDVDNAPANVKELKKLDSWDCKMSATSLGTTPKLIKWALGSADIDASNPQKIIPRRDLSQDDFADLWWVGDRADGGLVAIQLKNALSTGGFSLKTTKNGKGNTSIEITGHVSIDKQDEVPMVFYSMDPATVTLDKSTATVNVEATTTLSATVSDGTPVTWSTSNASVATVADGVVTGVAAGTAIITADANGGSASCTVTVSAGV